MLETWYSIRGTGNIFFSGRSSWLQIQRSGRYRIFWEVVGLERGPLSVVGTVEELTECVSSEVRTEFLNV
jgi:hypothetical protein